MNTSLALGRFQFENLVRNKVPFLLFKSEVDVESLFGVLERLHLRNYTLVVQEWTLQEAEKAVKERGAAKETPLVLLCEEGQKSEALSQILAQAGYLNVYFVAGGFRGLQA